jgi:hypothetical protein
MCPSHLSDGIAADAGSLDAAVTPHYATSRLVRKGAWFVGDNLVPLEITLSRERNAQAGQHLSLPRSVVVAGVWHVVARPSYVLRGRAGSCLANRARRVAERFIGNSAQGGTYTPPR